jgi:HSP90 family molecular chaperone
LKAQAVGDKHPGRQAQLNHKKVLEINPRHPIIKQLLVTVQAGSQTAETEDVALYVFIYFSRESIFPPFHFHVYSSFIDYFLIQQLFLLEVD